MAKLLSGCFSLQLMRIFAGAILRRIYRRGGCPQRSTQLGLEPTVGIFVLNRMNYFTTCILVVAGSYTYAATSSHCSAFTLDGYVGSFCNINQNRSRYVIEINDSSIDRKEFYLHGSNSLIIIKIQQGALHFYDNHFLLGSWAPRGHIGVANLKFTSLLSKKEVNDSIIRAGYKNRFELGAENQVACNRQAIQRYFFEPNKLLEKPKTFKLLTALSYSRCAFGMEKVV